MYENVNISLFGRLLCSISHLLESLSYYPRNFESQLVIFPTIFQKNTFWGQKMDILLRKFAIFENFLKHLKKLFFSEILFNTSV